jgi:hypothetical protein
MKVNKKMLMNMIGDRKKVTKVDRLIKQVKDEKKSKDQTMIILVPVKQRTVKKKKTTKK